MLILPGLALAWAMNSGTVMAGTDGGTAMTFASRLMAAIGAVSRMKLKLSLSDRQALMALGEAARSSVKPSGAERTVASAATLVPAPGRFSTTNGWLRRSDSHCATRRARMSDALPALKPTRMRTGRVG